MKLFPTSLLLGLAGIDPTGVIVIISALAMGVKKSKIILFVLTVFFGTIVVGLISSNLVIDNSINFFANLFNYIPDYVYMILEFVVGILLLLWFIERVFYKDKSIAKEEKKESIFTKYIKKGLFFVGLIFSLSALTDPSFLALITLTGQSSNLIEVILANVSWVLISQLPIFILLIAVIFNKHYVVIDFFKNKVLTARRIELIKKILSVLLSIIILFASILLLLEAIYYFFTNTWLF